MVKAEDYTVEVVVRYRGMTMFTSRVKPEITRSKTISSAMLHINHLVIAVPEEDEAVIDRFVTDTERWGG